MSKTKHTPGPWRCTKYPKVFSINSERGRQIAIMTEHHGDCPEVPMSQFERSQQDAADAALIAAAPEMLEALEAIAELFGDDDKFNDLNCRRIAIKIYKDAIAKAKGEV